MDNDSQSLEQEKETLRAVADKGTGAKLKTYSKLCGPGWLQSAITLGGGSLVGALGLGVIGGTHFMWVQPLAMILGIVMLSAIAYVTLSTGKRPFRAINEHVTPVLGWGWIIATMLANIIWCLPQFNLAYGAITKNLVPSIPDGVPAKLLLSALVLGVATSVVWSYGSGSKGVKLFESILKLLVGIIVIAFVGVVLTLTFSDNSPLNWGAVFAGLIPDFSALFKPAPLFQDAINQLDTETAKEWTAKVTAKQRDSIITAFGTAVGINMTFLLPYSMLRRGWGREHRGLAVFDLSTGLFIPFVIATGCLVIASAAQFYGNDNNLNYASSPALVSVAGETASPEELKTAYDTLAGPEKANATLEMMMGKRTQWDLANALTPFTGKIVAQIVFGVGVLAMAISTIVILMLINGFAFCEMLNLPTEGRTFRVGCLIAGIIGFFGPMAWGNLGPWLALPTSVIGFSLLPIAYVAFLFLMNSKSLLGDSLPSGGSKIRWNALMIVATLVALLGASWASHGKISGMAAKYGLAPELGWIGPGLIVLLGIASALTWRGGKIAEP